MGLFQGGNGCLYYVDYIYVDLIYVDGGYIELLGLWAERRSWPFCSGGLQVRG